MYLLETSTTGFDATSEICPSGNAIGELSNIIVHSTEGVGLKITTLISRTYPCQPVSTENILDKYSLNPSINNTISNITIYKSGGTGLYVQDVGSTLFVNVTVADCANTGISFDNTDHSDYNVTIQNTIFVGSSINNGDSSAGRVGLSVPASTSFKVSGITFYRLFTGYSIVVPYHNPNYVATFFEKVHYINMGTEYVRWGDSSDIFYDLDGSLSKIFFSDTTSVTFSSATLTRKIEMNLVPNICFETTVSAWGPSMLCNQQATIRSIRFSDHLPLQWTDLNFRIMNTTDNSELPTSTSSTYYYWNLPFICGRTYKVTKQAEKNVF